MRRLMVLVIAMAGCDAAQAKTEPVPKFWHCIVFDPKYAPGGKIFTTCMRTEAECGDLSCFLAERAWCGDQGCTFQKEFCDDIHPKVPCKHVTP